MNDLYMKDNNHLKMPGCCAAGCNADWRRAKNKSFHSFPFGKPELLAQWIANMGQPNWMPGRFSRLCCDHFLPKDFDRTGRTVRLRDSAVPTLFECIKSNSQNNGKLVDAYGESSETGDGSTQENLAEENSKGDLSKEHDTDDEVNDSFKSDLLPVLHEFQKESYLCDTVLIGEDGRVKAHGVVLAATSTTLKSALKPGTKVHSIVIPGVELWVLETIVHYTYTGEIQVTEECMTPEHLSRLFSVLEELGFSVGDIHLPGTTSNSSSLKNYLPKCDADTETDSEQDCKTNSQNAGINAKPETPSKRKTNFQFKKLGIKQEEDDCDVEDSLEKNEGLCSGFYNRLCDQCGKVFDDARKYQAHKKVHMKEPAHCPECGLMCSSRTNLRRHMFLHTGERPHLCQHCGEGFIQRQSLEVHLVSFHLDLIKNDPNFVEYECERCRKKFYDDRQFLRHINSECNSGQYIDESEDSKLSRRRISDIADRPYGCTKCNKRFRLKASQIIHDQVHTKKKLTTSKKARRDESESKRNVCRICGKWFKIRAAMALHEKHHSEGKLLESPICSKNSVASGMDMDSSELRDNSFGEKPYACRTCGMKFKVRESLLTHERSHTGEKPYQCPECGHQTAYAGSLNTHMRVHTGEMPYTCPVCGKQLRQSAHLVRHMWTHTGEKPYKCPFCEKGYKNRIDLRFHCQRVHQCELPKHRGVRIPTEKLFVKTEIHLVE